jgi:vitamin B12 transporter
MDLMKRSRIQTAMVLMILLLNGAVRAEDLPATSAKEGAAPREELVFSYTRQATPKSDVAANISVITREEIEKLPVYNAGEALQYIPGVYIEFNGGSPGSFSAASIQGSEVRHVAVFQDNVPLNLLANPVTDLALLPIANIERIEVYQGAASSAWGSGLGGVINIITREPDLTRPIAVDITSSYGQFNTIRDRGTVSGTVDRIGYLVSMTYEQSDGIMPHNDYSQSAAYAKVNYYAGESSRLNFIYSYDQGRNESPIPVWPSRGYFEDDLQRRSYERMLFETSPMDNLNVTVEGRHQEYTASSDNVFPYLVKNRFKYSQKTFGASTRASYDLEANRFLVGFDGDWGDYDFSSYSQTFNSGNWALYANDSYEIGRFTFNAGLRNDNNIDFGNQVSPSGGVVYRVLDQIALLRGQIARGFSAPPGAWVTDPIYGNKDLKAETAINYQLGAEIKAFKFLNFQLNFFRADVNNLLRFNPSLGEFGKYENIDQAIRQGVEGRIGAKFDWGLGLSFGGSFIDVRDAQTHQIIPDIPRILYDASATYTYKWMSHSLIGRYVFNNSSYPETRDQVFVFDYMLKVKLPFIPECAGKPGIFFAVHNITNTTYLLRYVYPQPGRWVEGGINYQF